MKIAIVGSRGYAKLDMIRPYIERLDPETEIITGDASGVDAAARTAALACGLITTVVPARWKDHGRAAGPIRNKIIAARCDLMIAFWNGSSRGTLSSIQAAKERGKEVVVIR